MLSYTIYSGLVLVALYLTYKWMLAGERQHAYNRAVLLTIYAVALATPALAALLADALRPAPGSGLIDLDFIPVAVSEEGGDGAALSPWRIALWVYFAGVAAAAVASAATAIRLAAIISSGERRPCGRYTLVLLDRTDIAPFSWRRYIVISRDDYEKAGPMILAHECEHLRLRHWIDLLVAQLVAVMMWYNPAAWLMREELKTVHEYQADECVLAAGVNAREYQMLLIKKAVGARFPSLANSLNHSKLKKRITMMYNPKTSAGRRLRVLSLAPALAIAILGANLPLVSNAMESLASTPLTAAVPAPAEVAAPAQADSKVTEKPATAQDFPAGSTRPDYPDHDEQAMRRYMMMNVHYPQAAMDAGIEGRVVVLFDILEDGSVANARVARSLSPECDAEAVRVVSAMPKWIPGTVDGKPVKTTFAMPVNFRLEKDDEDPQAKAAVIKFDKAQQPGADAPAVFIDGKEVPHEELDKISRDAIESMTVKKDDPAYPNGKILITLKK